MKFEVKHLYLPDDLWKKPVGVLRMVTSYTDLVEWLK